MRVSSFFGAINLARKAISTANRNPQDIKAVLLLVNARAHERCGQYFADKVGAPINLGFKVKGRGYDALPLPGFPTCWIWCPNGYRFKVALDEKCRDILSEDFSQVK